MRLVSLTLLLGIALILNSALAENTAEMLGYGSEARLLIINADDFGMCHAENQATMDLLMSGSVTSASVMTPCPWFREVANFYQNHPDVDVGVHLTLNAEWNLYKWGSVASADQVSSLLTPAGFFYPDIPPVEQNAVREEVRTEFIAQIEKALQSGIQPTHMDNHMGSAYGLVTGNDFLDVVFELSAKYGLPFRLPREVSGQQNLSPERIRKFKRLTQDLIHRGFVLPDYLLTVEHADTQESTLERYKELFRKLKPGVTELYIHAALPTAEMKAISGAWERRKFDYHIFSSPEIHTYLDSLGIRLISWSELQHLQAQQLEK